MTAPARTVVFDFDHTLYNGDSGQHFISWMLRRSIWRSFLALLIAPMFAPMTALLPTRRKGLSAFVWAATLGIRESHALDPFLHHYVAEHAAALRVRLLPAAFKVLQQHLDAGDKVVVATGAPPALVQRILALAQYGDLPIIGTIFGVCLGGLTIARHCHFKEKVHMLRESGHTGIDIAYSDSSADLPLLKAAHQPVVVNPRHARMALFQRLLPEGTPILNWGCPQRAGVTPETE